MTEAGRCEAWLAHEAMGTMRSSSLEAPCDHLAWTLAAEEKQALEGFSLNAAGCELKRGDCRDLYSAAAWPRPLLANPSRARPSARSTGN